MKLVKIDEMGYINADKVDLIIKDGSNKTRIYFGVGIKITPFGYR